MVRVHMQETFDARRGSLCQRMAPPSFSILSPRDMHFKVLDFFLRFLETTLCRVKGVFRNPVVASGFELSTNCPQQL
jgi:hypothetical protein